MAMNIVTNMGAYTPPSHVNLVGPGMGPPCSMMVRLLAFEARTMMLTILLVVFASWMMAGASTMNNTQFDADAFNSSSNDTDNTSASGNLSGSGESSASASGDFNFNASASSDFNFSASASGESSASGSGNESSSEEESSGNMSSQVLLMSTRLISSAVPTSSLTRPALTPSASQLNFTRVMSTGVLPMRSTTGYFSSSVASYSSISSAATNSVPVTPTISEMVPSSSLLPTTTTTPPTTVDTSPPMVFLPQLAIIAITIVGLLIVLAVFTFFMLGMCWVVNRCSKRKSYKVSSVEAEQPPVIVVAFENPPPKKLPVKLRPMSEVCVIENLAYTTFDEQNSNSPSGSQRGSVAGSDQDPGSPTDDQPAEATTMTQEDSPATPQRSNTGNVRDLEMSTFSTHRQPIAV